MENQIVKAVAILKAIKDGSAKNARALKVKFKSEGDGTLISHLIKQLEAAKLIKLAHGGEYIVTPSWTRIEQLLDINLTALITLNSVFSYPLSFSPPVEIFVLMPFDESLKPVFEDHICPVARRLGRSIARADDFFTPDVIMNNIWAAIYHSQIVIADCTGRNANVFYEIGLAHALGKPVILITQNQDDVPFDLKQRRFIKYSFTPRGMHDLEETLYKSVSALLQ